MTAPNKNKIKLDLNSKYFTKITFYENQDELLETPKTYKYKGKFVFKEIFGKKLTKIEAKKLLENEEILLKRTSKKGKEYEVTVWLSEKNNGTVESSF